jgi:hypothetical protein
VSGDALTAGALLLARLGVGHLTAAHESFKLAVAESKDDGAYDSDASGDGYQSSDFDYDSDDGKVQAPAEAGAEAQAQPHQKLGSTCLRENSV